MALMRLHALRLVGNGLHVFPVAVRGKIPATVNGFKDASTDPNTVEDWWALDPNFNIGIATGASDLLVVDVDGPEGAESLKALEAENAPLPETITVKTGKGVHYYFRRNGHTIGCSTSKLANKIDIRAEGGYVVCPPSVHESGKQYKWARTGPLADTPEWLINRLYNLRSPERARKQWDDLQDVIPEGERDCALTSICGHLLVRSVDPGVVEWLLRAANQCYCDPPLPYGDIDRITDSILRKELKRRGVLR